MPSKVLAGLTGCETMSGHNHHVHMIKTRFSQEQVQCKMNTGKLHLDFIHNGVHSFKVLHSCITIEMCVQVLMLLDYS